MELFSVINLTGKFEQTFIVESKPLPECECLDLSSQSRLHNGAGITKITKK